MGGSPTSSNVAPSIAYTPNEVDLVLTAPTTVAIPTNSAIFSDTPSVGTDNSYAALDTVFDHLTASLTDDGNDDVETALASATPLQFAFNGGQVAQLSDAAQGLPAAMKRNGGWFRAIGAFNSAHGQGAAPGYSGRSGGFLAGIDQKITSDLTLGLAGGYSHTDLSQSDGTAGTIETPRVIGYGLYRIGNLALEERTLGLAYDRITTARPIAALGASAVEGHNGFEKNVALQAAYPLAAADYTIVPRAGIQYARLDENKFTESGASGFDLASGANTTESLQPSVGASVLTSFATDGGIRITPEFKALFAHELLGTSRNLVLTTASGSAVNALGVSAAHNTLTIGPTLTAQWAGGVELVADYKLALGLGKSVGHTIFGGIRCTLRRSRPPVAICRTSGYIRAPFRGVAQPGRALASGARSRRFESSRPDHFSRLS